MTERGDWVGYYDEQGDRAPRDLLVGVLDRFEREGVTGAAVDLGCGQGIETAAMLARGWTVTAIDAQEDGIRRLRERVPVESAGRLITRISLMEDAELPPSDLVHASYSLPFCRPDAFPALWGRVRDALRPGGRFAGELFGDRDTWASTEDDMTFFGIDAARALFDGLDLESFEEEESDDEGWGEIKHWHVFHAIARRPG
jgi:SAM-dependent methyltransferase